VIRFVLLTRLSLIDVAAGQAGLVVLRAEVGLC
jgi:hypothetical protein